MPPAGVEYVFTEKEEDDRDSEAEAEEARIEEEKRQFELDIQRRMAEANLRAMERTAHKKGWQPALDMKVKTIKYEMSRGTNRQENNFEILENTSMQLHQYICLTIWTRYALTQARERACLESTPARTTATPLLNFLNNSGSKIIWSNLSSQ